MNAAVEQGIFKHGEAFPTICLNKTIMDHMLRMEMDQEKANFPEWYKTQGGDEGLKKRFANVSLCSMDDEMLLATGVLDSVFEAVNNK